MVAPALIAWFQPLSWTSSYGGRKGAKPQLLLGA
jgi:hypothetical protein